MTENSSTEFKPAICPKCNGELRVPATLAEVVCSYCGTRFAPHSTAAAQAGPQNQIENWTALAEAAEEAHDCAKAAEYWTRILEVDAGNYDVWVERGVCLAIASRANREGLREAMVCFTKAAALRPDADPGEYVSANLLIGTANYLGSALDLLSQALTDYVKRNATRSQSVVVGGGVAENLGAGVGSAIGNAWSENSTWKSHRKDVSQQFLDAYAPLVVESVRYAWRVRNSKDTAKRTCEILSIVAGAPILTEEAKRAFEGKLASQVQEIRSSYPDLAIPAIEPDRKDTFDHAGSCLKTSAWAVVIIVIIAVILLCALIGSG